MAMQRIAATVGIGLVVGVAGSRGSLDAGGLAVFGIGVALAFAINLVVYIPAQLQQTETYFDATGASTYLCVTAAAVVLSDDLDTRAVLVALMVVVWAARLGSFLFRRIRHDGGDRRFDRIKTNPLQFFMTWLMQGLWVALTISGALAIITTNNPKDFGVFGVIGAAMWFVGFVVEVTADRQKSAFRSDPANVGRFINSGLWAWSRHPNYFGEILLWSGIFVMALPVLESTRWVVVISPVFVFFLLAKISGVPMLERRAQRTWGDEAGFQAYIASTPVIMMRPPRS